MKMSATLQQNVVQTQQMYIEHFVTSKAVLQK